MRLLFVADLHYSLKQFDWLLAHAGDYEAVIIGGDLLDLSSALEADVQIAIVERYFRLIQSRSALSIRDTECRAHPPRLEKRRLS